MAAQSITELPEGDDWLYELKLDGYRALLIKDDDRAQIRSRNDKDLTRMFPRVAAEKLTQRRRQAGYTQRGRRGRFQPVTRYGPGRSSEGVMQYPATGPLVSDC